MKRVMDLEITDIVSVESIPPQVRSCSYGRKQNIMRKLFDALAKLNKGQALVVKHNCPTASYFHGRVQGFAKEQGLANPEVYVRGDRAYIVPVEVS